MSRNDNIMYHQATFKTSRENVNNECMSFSQLSYNILGWIDQMFRLRFQHNVTVTSKRSVWWENTAWTTTRWNLFMGRVMEDVTTRRNIFLSLSKLEWPCGPQEFNSWKNHLHLTFKWVGIKATTVVKAQVFENEWRLAQWPQGTPRSEVKSGT